LRSETGKTDVRCKIGKLREGKKSIGKRGTRWEKGSRGREGKLQRRGSPQGEGGMSRSKFHGKDSLKEEEACYSKGGRKKRHLEERECHEDLKRKGMDKVHEKSSSFHSSAGERSREPENVAGEGGFWGGAYDDKISEDKKEY